MKKLVLILVFLILAGTTGVWAVSTPTSPEIPTGQCQSHPAVQTVDGKIIVAQANKCGTHCRCPGNTKCDPVTKCCS